MYLESINHEISNIPQVKIFGKVLSANGIIIKCHGLNNLITIGTQCKIIRENTDNELLCETVGFDGDCALLIPFEDMEGVGPGLSVAIHKQNNVIYPHNTWRGRIVNGFGEPIDNLGPLSQGHIPYKLKNRPPNANSRHRLGDKIDFGVKAIDTFISCCLGQRMGIFAGSGVGKSILVSMLAKYTNTDIRVVGLIGERSREAKEFIEEYLGEEGLANTIVVLSTGDESPLLRKRATYLTMAIAEYFRDQGNQVLCIVDSITRFAMAQREIGLAAGEPPTTRGYTPSVFAELPKILERAGPGTNHHHITGVFSVLVEGDDQNEPISDAIRGILDGHIVLDRAIAERNRFPAIDVLKSISRTMPKCNSELETKQISYAKKMLSIYRDMSDMIKLGAYKAGTDPDVDLAIKYFDQIENFLKQSSHEHYSSQEAYAQLGKILSITK